VKKFVDESWLVLILGVVFAVMLAGAQTGLQAKIVANEAEALNTAVSEVVPGVVDKEELTIDGNKVFRCLNAEGKLAGWAVQAVGPGFIDKITIVVGLAPAFDKFTGVKTLKHTETPGLGNKIDTKGELNFYPLQYTGMKATVPLALVKAKTGAENEIQAITGATYSSQYVMDIVNDVIERVRPKLIEQR